MKNTRLCLWMGLLLCSLSFSFCGKDPSCSDGKKNQDETGVDCGGPCADCETCTDGILNQDETGIDCGGSCANDCVSCSDGIQNQGETGIDCGGPNCSPCSSTPSCNDGIQNQGETGIDCGGPNCNPCTTQTGTLTATIDGTAWTASNIVATELGTKLNIVAFDAFGKSITLVHNGAFAVGTYNVSSTATASYANTVAGIACLSTSSGTLTFTTFNTTTQKVSGSFAFNCSDPSTGGHTVSGTFTNVTYN